MIIRFGRLVAASGAAAAAGPARPTALEARPAPGSPMAVPEGNGAPVITDGAFSPGEWDDALRVPVGNSVGLYSRKGRASGNE